MAETRGNPRFNCPLASSYKRLFIPAWQFQGLASSASVDAGAPVVAEISSTGVTGIQINADGDAISTILPVPHDMDVAAAANFYIYYIDEEAAINTGVDWKIHHNPIAELEALAAGASGTEIVVDADTTTADAWAVNITAAAALAAASWVHGDVVVISVECDDNGDAAADKLYLLGLMLEYRTRTFGGA